MKVLCINATPLESAFIDPSCDKVKEGQVYTVFKEVVGMYEDGSTVDCYLLEEKSKDQGFEKFRFIPLSDIDEMEYYKQKQLQTQ